jgi:hypothetical protein
MSKIGVGVGEEFPIDEGKPPSGPPGEGGPSHGGHGGPPPWRRNRYWHFAHHLLHVALIVAVIFALASFFHPHPFWHGYAGGPPAPGAHPFAAPYYWAPHFPFGLIAFAVLISLFVFGRHRHHHHHRHWRHWHDECPRSHREEV